MPTVLIRAMAPDDIPAVSAIDHQCFALPWSAGAFAGELASPVGRYRVALLGDTIAGYLGGHLILDEAHVVTLGVHPQFRRRGIAEHLLVEFLETALGRGCRRLTLEVREGNVEARGLYAKYGFRPISRRRRYYTDNDEDAIVMWIEDASRSGFRATFDERVQQLRKRSG